MPKVTTRILLSDDDKEYLKSLVRNRTIQAQIVDRSRILLSKSEGKADKTVADGLGISVNTVRRCVSRYNEGGVKLALFDDDRSGRPVEITDDAKAWMSNPSRLNTISKERSLILTKKYLATLPEGRFEFVFTPTHSSWLNMIESFFSKMTKQMPKGIRVNSKEELSARIYQYLIRVSKVAI